MMHVERLTVLAEHLEQLDHTLNMNRWKCGTAACAMGEACCIPNFMEQGLFLERDEPGSNSFVPVFKDENGYWQWGFAAAQSFFELTWDQSRKLFHPDYYDGSYDAVSQLDPKIVATRIRQLIAEHQAQEKQS